MKIYAIWYGGSGYGLPDLTGDRDIEQYPSIKAACDNFMRRFGDSYYPCLEDPEMHVFLGYHPAESEFCPDRIIKRGPRGGCVVERT